MDKILINGAVYTMDDANPTAEAIAIDGKKIAAVGTTEEISALATEETEIIDLQGQMAIPGLIDGHLHPYAAASYMNMLFIDESLDYQGILKTVREYVESKPDADYYLGYNYNALSVFTAGGYNLKDLDDICPDKPLLLFVSGLHGGWCNSKCFKTAGITKETPDVIKDVMYYGKDENGELTGEMVELGSLIPVMIANNMAGGLSMAGSLEDLSKQYAEAGVTTMGGCGDQDFTGADPHEILNDCIEKGIVKQRIIDCIYCANPDQLAPHLELLKELNKKYNTDNYRVNVYKIMMDGTSETCSAAFSFPTAFAPTPIPTIMSLEDSKKYYLLAAEAGFDIHTHAIGDAAIKVNLDAAEYVRQQGYTDTRITNAHSQFIAPEDRKRFAELNVIMNTSGQWQGYYEGNEESMGEEASSINSRYREALDAGATLALGSDRPADGAGWDPRIAIYTAMERKHPWYADDPDAKRAPGEEDKFTIEECLKAYTVNNAYQLHMEDRLGKLKEGFYADIAVFEKDMFKVETKEIIDDKVTLTIIDGEIAYRA